MIEHLKKIVQTWRKLSDNHPSVCVASLDECICNARLSVRFFLANLRMTKSACLRRLASALREFGNIEEVDTQHRMRMELRDESERDLKWFVEQSRPFRNKIDRKSKQYRILVLTGVGRAIRRNLILYVSSGENERDFTITVLKRYCVLLFKLGNEWDAVTDPDIVIAIRSAERAIHRLVSYHDDFADRDEWGNLTGSELESISDDLESSCRTIDRLYSDRSS